MAGWVSSPINTRSYIIQLVALLGITWDLSIFKPMPSSLAQTQTHRHTNYTTHLHTTPHTHTTHLHTTHYTLHYTYTTLHTDTHTIHIYYTTHTTLTHHSTASRTEGCSLTEHFSINLILTDTLAAVGEPVTSLGESAMDTFGKTEGIWLL